MCRTLRVVEPNQTLRGHHHADRRASIQFYFMRQNDEFFRPFHKTAVVESLLRQFAPISSWNDDAERLVKNQGLISS